MNFQVKPLIVIVLSPFTNYSFLSSSFPLLFHLLSCQKGSIPIEFLVNPSISTSLLNSDDFIKKCDSLPYLLQMIIQNRFSSEKEENDAILKYLEEKSIKIDTEIRSFVAAFPSMLVESGEKVLPVASRDNAVKEDKQSLLWKHYLSKLYEINHNMIQNNKQNDLEVDPSLRNEKKYYKEKSFSYLKDIYSSSLSLYGQHHQFTQRTLLSLFSSYLYQYYSSHSPTVTTSPLLYHSLLSPQRFLLQTLLKN
jgi:hypothetical protein